MDQVKKLSYALGWDLGKRMKMQFSALDLTEFKNSIESSFQEEQPKVPVDEMKELLMELQEKMANKQREMIVEASKENLVKSERFLEENRDRPNIHTLASGLQYEVLQTGIDGPSPSSFHTVEIHARGYLPDGTLIQSTEGKDPIKGPLNQLIPGWAEALRRMHIGEKWRLFLHPANAYGEMGVPQAGIPPNAVIICELELVAFQ